LFQTGIHYQQQRSVNVLIPGTTTSAGPAETYFYDARGNETTPSIYQIDASLEATFTVWSTLEVGIKGEAFNVTNVQHQTNVNNFNWCGDATAGPATACGIARATFGTATARGSYQAPRAYRLTTLLRF
jgi:hypothetical protein